MEQHDTRMAWIRAERQRNELALVERNRREMRERKKESSYMSCEDKGRLLKEFACVGLPGSHEELWYRLAYVTNGGTEVLEAILTGCTASNRSNLPPKRLASLFTRPESEQCVALNRYLAVIARQNRRTLFCTFDATKVCNKILADAAGNVQIPTLWLVKDGKVTHRMRGLAELGGDQCSWKTVATVLQIHGLIEGSVPGSGLYTTTSDLYFLLLRLSQPPLRSDFNRVAGWRGKILRHIVEFIGPAWRKAIKVGDAIDARDSEGRWFDSRVVQVDQDRVKVHFNRCDSHSGTWFERTDEGLQPYRSWTKDDWRAGRRLRVGDRVEILGHPNCVLAETFEGRVYKVDGTRVLVGPLAALTFWRDEFYRYDLRASPVTHNGPLSGPPPRGYVIIYRTTELWRSGGPSTLGASGSRRQAPQFYAVPGWVSGSRRRPFQCVIGARTCAPNNATTRSPTG
jgi:hypothetical protein